MREEGLIKITIEDLKYIVEEEYEVLERMARFNSFCGNCYGKREVEMIDFELYLNRLNDVIFEGKCKGCSKSIARYIEIGENPMYYMKTKHIKNKKR